MSWAKTRAALAAHLPAKLGEFVYPYRSRNIVDRQHGAANDGFWILGTNGETALPALSNLLVQGRDHMELSCAIPAMGSKGIELLTNALAFTNGNVLDAAALALGFQYQLGKSAVPALLNCVEHGYASYQVLGALGRIGCDDPRLVPALVRLAQTGSLTNGFCSEEMAFLLLGLQREKARAAAPLVINKYRLVASDPSAVKDRLFYRRILRAIAPDMEAQLPPIRPDEESEDWP